MDGALRETGAPFSLEARLSVEPISQDDEALLNHCRRLARRIAADAYGEAAADAFDIEMLQRLLDDGICAREDAWGLQSLGIRFGDLLCREGFSWVVRVHGDDRNLAVAWRDSGLSISAPVLIQKRVEDGEECDIAALFDWAVSLAEVKEES
jgi:hypothetical protein